MFRVVNLQEDIAAHHVCTCDAHGRAPTFRTYAFCVLGLRVGITENFASPAGESILSMSKSNRLILQSKTRPAGFRLGFPPGKKGPKRVEPILWLGS